MKQNTEKEIAALQAQIAALQEKKNQEQRAEASKLGKIIDGLPKSLGQENLEGVMGLIRRHMKSPLGSVDSTVVNVSERKPRTILSAEDKAAIVARVLAGEQRSAVLADSAKNGKDVVYGTLQNWLSDATITAAAKALNATKTAAPAPAAAPTV
jgi:hypothetical protein